MYVVCMYAFIYAFLNSYYLSRYRLKNNGKMRLRILPEIMKDLGIQVSGCNTAHTYIHTFRSIQKHTHTYMYLYSHNQMDKGKLPKEFWYLKKDFLIYDLTDLKKWVDKVRYRAPIKLDILDSRLAYIHKYIHAYINVITTAFGLG